MVEMALMDYVLLPKRMLGRLLDAKVWRLERRIWRNSVKERAYMENKSVERWRRRECVEGVGKVQKYSNGVYQ